MLVVIHVKLVLMIMDALGILDSPLVKEANVNNAMPMLNAQIQLLLNAKEISLVEIVLRILFVPLIMQEKITVLLELVKSVQLMVIAQEVLLSVTQDHIHALNAKLMTNVLMRFVVPQIIPA